MYEPIHGSAPDIAGQNIANPIGTILAAGMMLKYAFDMDQEAAEIEEAVEAALRRGISHKGYHGGWKNIPDMFPDGRYDCGTDNKRIGSAKESRQDVN